MSQSDACHIGLCEHCEGGSCSCVCHEPRAVPIEAPPSTGPQRPLIIHPDDCGKYDDGARVVEAATSEGATPLIDYDNHHNAAKCPYCSPHSEIVSLRARLAEVEREREEQKDAREFMEGQREIEAQRARNAEARVEELEKAIRHSVNCFDRNCKECNERAALQHGGEEKGK